MGRPANSSLEKQPPQSGRDPRTPEPKPGPYAPPRGKLLQLLWPITSYMVTNVTVTLLWLVLFVLNRTRVIGRRNVGEERNTLLLSNHQSIHQSMLDSFLLGLAAFYPQSCLKPQLIPWNPAAAENFYKNPLLAWLADNWKCIWVREGRRDLHALHRMIQVLPRGVMTVFPEGTRSRDGSVGPGRPGAGAADDSRCDRRDARGASHRSLRPADLQANLRVLWPARGLRGVSRDAAHAGDGRGCDRPRDGSNSGPARRAPVAAQRRREWEIALIVLVHRDGRRAPSRAWSFTRNALWSNWECSCLPGAAASPNNHAYRLGARLPL